MNNIQKAVGDDKLGLAAEQILKIIRDNDLMGAVCLSSENDGVTISHISPSWSAFEQRADGPVPGVMEMGVRKDANKDAINKTGKLTSGLIVLMGDVTSAILGANQVLVGALHRLAKQNIAKN